MKNITLKIWVKNNSLLDGITKQDSCLFKDMNAISL